MANSTETSSEATKAPRTNSKVGVVVSNKMNKTVVVAVNTTVVSDMYRKYIKRTSRFLAHCETNDLNVGDQVVIEETRPLSRRKRWNVKEIIRRAS